MLSMFKTLAVKTYNYLFPLPPYYLEDYMANRAYITNLNNGRYGLATSEGLVASYSRRRDAVRGAKRAGLVLAS